VPFVLEQESVLTGVNAGLRQIPVDFMRLFVDDFAGFLRYDCFPQLAGEELASMRPARGVAFVRFLESGRYLAGQYGGAIGEVVEWGGFVQAFADRLSVLGVFVEAGDGILFEIQMSEDSIAAIVGDTILMLAGTAFRIERVGEFSLGNEGGTTPRVILKCVGAWSDYGIETRTPLFGASGIVLISKERRSALGTAS
jgi:hypothetical protein